MDKKLRGFAAMDPEKQRRLAVRGGHNVPPEKRSFSVNRNLASAAGRKGGISVPSERRTFSTNHELAREAGRKGGKTTHKKELSNETS